MPAILGLLAGLGTGWAIHRPAAPAPATPTSSHDLTASQRIALGDFVHQYFGSWSARNIDAYGKCFHPNARIWFGTGTSAGLPEFLDSQREAHARSPVPLSEDPIEWDGNTENGLAHVRVHWELHRGVTPVRGYDFFTLAFTEGRWQIVALVFNEE